MVSILDWSKFQHLNDSQKEASNVGGLSKYYKQREEEVIRQAEHQGLLRTATQEFLVKQCGYVDGRYVKDVTKYQLVRLCGVHLRKIGDVMYCANLRVCILSNNFLTKFDGLASCKQLIKLDLHSNQLSDLPGITFWSTLRSLRFLFLHDNPIGQYENMQNLATCPNLTALTMFDTPLCLKRNYRHHVVNSIWSLKALDHFVISDEEIIEDAMFGGTFSANLQCFKITLFHQTPKDYTIKDELKLIRETESQINNILAHHSPVLIIQKFMRGYLSRKKYGSIRKIKLLKSLLPPGPSDVVPPPTPMSEITIQGQAGFDLHIDEFEHGDFKERHRQSSASPSDTTSYLREVYLEPLQTPQDMISYTRAGAGTPSAFHSRNNSPKKRKNLHINLAKLQAGTFSSLYDAEQIAIETILPQDSSAPAETLKKKGKKKQEKMTERRIVKSVKQFFGPVVTATPPPGVGASPEEDEGLPLTEYRLQGYRPNITLVDPTAEMIMSKQDAGRLVRDAELDLHRKLHDQSTPRIKAANKSVTNDQRIFSRVHGSMSMSCLYAVHQAYKDRDKAERTATKMEHILNMRDERDKAKERIKLYHEEKRSTALRLRDMERAKTLEQLEKRETTRITYLNKRHEIKNKSVDLSRTYKQDFTFITEFSNQHTSVSNALMRHDRQAKFEDQLQNKSELVHNLTAAEAEQKETVKKYLEHRQLMRQTESAMARATLDTRLLQEINDHMLEAKTRIAQQKARHDTMQAFYPLPMMTPVPTSSSAPPKIIHGLTHWETNLMVHQGRVGKHPTVVQ